MKSDMRETKALSEKEKEGIWFEVCDRNGKPLPGVFLRVASIDKPEYQDDLEKAMRNRANRQQRIGGMRRKPDVLPSVDEQRRMENEALARHIMIDWDGVTFDGGKPLEVTFENKIALLEELPLLRLDVLEFAADVAAFEDAELGNSRISRNNNSPSAASAESSSS